MKAKDNYFGASLSIKTCRDWQINDIEVLKYAVKELGIKHFRLMSYWNVIENRPDKYDFTYLDAEFKYLEKVGAKVTLCLGKRQPRWPECHIPDWAVKLPKEQWYEALFKFIKTVVKRYKDSPALISYQLENEALLKKFGYCPDGDYSRKRLKRELKLVKSLDKNHPVIMSLSNNWGLPILGPLPDIFGVSLYGVIYKNNQYTKSWFPWWWYVARAKTINLYTSRSTFIHELQAEPWGPAQNYNLSVKEQNQSMSKTQLAKNIKFAKKVGFYPIYLWGLEWWYARKFLDKKPTNIDKILL